MKQLTKSEKIKKALLELKSKKKATPYAKIRPIPKSKRGVKNGRPGEQPERI